MTLTCEDLVDLIFDFVDGGLPEEQLVAFKTHLCKCKPCEKSVGLYQVTIRITKALPKADPLPAAFEQRLRAALAGTPAAG